VRQYFPTAKVQFIVESGPFASDMSVIYEDVRKTAGSKYRPAKYAEMLVGFAHRPKGVLRSLEAADYLAGRAISDLQDGSFISSKRKNIIASRLDRELLLDWYNEMQKEREHRFAYKKSKSGAAKSV
jgi:hypothetical protein